MTPAAGARRRQGRALGIDLGSRRIGIAVSDARGTTATPYAVLARSSDDRDARAVAELYRAEEAREVVVGLPLRLDGTKGDAALVVEGFAARLKSEGLRVRLWDERFSTVEAGRCLRAGGTKPRARRAVVDKVAAAIILQGYLDSRS
ncbi:MAG: Holliday junction resolvase RuvX [Acidobacteria bacterium]|nr:Holliday junction resolvase RuvX [Acidobacteriota bacterium]